MKNPHYGRMLTTLFPETIAAAKRTIVQPSEADSDQWFDPKAMERHAERLRDGIRKNLGISVPVTAEDWRTMDADLFRDLASSPLSIRQTEEAADAMRERAAALGIKLEPYCAECQRRHVIDGDSCY